MLSAQLDFQLGHHELESFFSHPHVSFSPPSTQKISEYTFRSFLHTRGVKRNYMVHKRKVFTGKRTCRILTLPTMCNYMVHKRKAFRNRLKPTYTKGLLSHEVHSSNTCYIPNTWSISTIKDMHVLYITWVQPMRFSIVLKHYNFGLH
jgi:hypothetical protein